MKFSNTIVLQGRMKTILKGREKEKQKDFRNTVSKVVAIEDRRCSAKAELKNFHALLADLDLKLWPIHPDHLSIHLLTGIMSVFYLTYMSMTPFEKFWFHSTVQWNKAVQSGCSHLCVCKTHQSFQRFIPIYINHTCLCCSFSKQEIQVCSHTVCLLRYVITTLSRAKLFSPQAHIKEIPSKTNDISSRFSIHVYKLNRLSMKKSIIHQGILDPETETLPF